MAKDTTWKDDIYVSCVAALNSGDVPDADYPIDETLEREKEEERMRKFDKVSLYLYFMLYTSFSMPPFHLFTPSGIHYIYTNKRFNKRGSSR